MFSRNITLCFELPTLNSKPKVLNCLIEVYLKSEFIFEMSLVGGNDVACHAQTCFVAHKEIVSVYSVNCIT